MTKQRGRRRAEVPSSSARTSFTRRPAGSTSRRSSGSHAVVRPQGAAQRKVGVPAITVAVTTGLVFTFSVPAYAADPVTVSTADLTSGTVNIPDLPAEEFTIEQIEGQDIVVAADAGATLQLSRDLAEAEDAPEPEPEPVVVAPTSSSGSSGSGSAAAGALEASGSEILAYGAQFLGVPYKFAGGTPAGFDCSGFTSYVYKKFGVNLPRSSKAQYNAGKKISMSDVKPGDLVYTPGHVGIYAGNGKILHSPRPGKSVQVSKMWSASWTGLRF